MGKEEFKMGLKKKLGLAVLTTTLGATMIAGGTFAYFNAQTTNSNNVFTSGKIQLDQTVNLGTHDNIKPGDNGDSTIVLTNLDSTLGSNLTAHFGALSDSTALAKAVDVTMTLDDIAVTLADVDGDGSITYADLAKQDIALGAFASTDTDKTVKVHWEFVDTDTAQNDLQGQTFTVPVNFEARQ